MSLSNFFRQFNCASNNGAISTNNTRQSKRKLKHNNSNLSNNRPSAPISPDHDSNHSINKIESSPECGQDFYEIGRFKVALKRCDNGAKLANDLNEMILERAKIEDDYGKSLKAWNNKWKKLLNSETNEEYGETTKNAWLAFLEAGNKTAGKYMYILLIRTCFLICQTFCSETKRF